MSGEVAGVQFRSLSGWVTTGKVTATMLTPQSQQQHQTLAANAPALSEAMENLIVYLVQT